MTNDTCPVCGLKLVLPFGRQKSPILLVGEAPGWKEVADLTPFVGETGEVLKAELSRAGIDYRYCRATNLWLHARPEGRGNSELKAKDFEYCFGQLLEQIATARVILMMGSELAKFLTGLPVSKINGARMSSQYIDPGTVAVFAYNPAIVLQENGVVGDFRLAVKEFARYAKPILREVIHER